MSLSEKDLERIQDALKDADFLDDNSRTDVVGDRLLKEDVLTLLSRVIVKARDDTDISTPRYHAKIAAMVLAEDIGLIVHGQPNTKALNEYKLHIGGSTSKDNKHQSIAIYVHQSLSEDLQNLDENSWVYPSIGRILTACDSSLKFLKSTGRFVGFDEINKI